MRITHVIPSLDPDCGGPPVVATRIAAAQAALGHSIRIISYQTPDDAKDRILSAINMIPGFSGIDIVEFPYESVTRLGVFKSDIRLPDSDYFHIHGIWEPLLPAVARWANEHGQRYCFVPHGMLDKWSLRQKFWKKRLALWLGWRKAIDGSAYIHILNQDEKDGLKPLKLSPPLETIPNGVFLEELQPEPIVGAFRRRRQFLGSDPYILFLSRLHYKKGLDYLADAFGLVSRVLPHVRLVVVGPDHGEQAAFEARIKSLCLTHRVHMLGALYGAEKLEAIRDAACFCLPSRQEGFSVAIVEALALGRPVVISTECHFPEVSEYDAGEVVALDARATADALIRILSDPEKAEQQGARGAALVRQRFTWERVAHQTIAAYERHGTGIN